MITVIGVGFKAGDITEQARAALKKAGAAFSRTALPVRTTVIRGEGGGYDSLNREIVATVTAAEKQHGEVVYAAAGDGYGDAAAAMLVKNHGAAFIPGISHAREFGGALTAVSAYELNRRSYLDTAVPLLIYDLDDKLIAGDIKLFLSDFYSDDTEVLFRNKSGVKRVPLHEIDRQDNYVFGSVYLLGEPDFVKKSRFAFSDILEIMRRLTDPDGCPWDRAQTHESIRVNLIEEAYEAADALISGDPDDIVEELGDVLLQVLFHADIAARTGEYTLNDIISRLCDKLISRHTHIFGEVKANDETEALAAWEAAKAKEKAYDSVAGQLARLPENFPGTLKYQKAVKKGAKGGAGYDLNSVKTQLGAELGKAAPDFARVLTLAAAAASLGGLDPEVVLLDAATDLTKRLGDAERQGKIDKVDTP